MDKESLQNIWSIIRNNDFEEFNDMNPDYLCTICKKLLIDAHSSPCGCRYCKDCIKEYLKHENKLCPGQLDYCKTNAINIDQDVHIDQAINIKILKLVVKCPNSNCQSIVELRAIANHLRICQNRPLHCPYLTLGCKEDKLINTKVDEHLTGEMQSHSKLLVEWIINSRNDTESLKREVENLKSDNEDMKERMRIDGERTQNIIRNLVQKERENSKEIHKLGDEMVALKNENRFLKSELKILKETEETQQMTNLQLRSQIEQQNQQIDQLEIKFQNEKSEFDKKFEMNHGKTREIEMKLNNMSEAKDSLETESIKSIDNDQKLIDEINVGQIMWRIDNWSYKRPQALNGINKQVYSEAFFSHERGYKMCLELWHDAICTSNYFSIHLCIVKGPFDNELRWPVKPKVHIYLMNQQTDSPYDTCTVSYSDNPNDEAWNKPINERNNSFNRSYFPISRVLIEDYSPLSIKDRLLIKCCVVST